MTTDEVKGLMGEELLNAEFCTQEAIDQCKYSMEREVVDGSAQWYDLYFELRELITLLNHIQDEIEYRKTLG